MDLVLGLGMFVVNHAPELVGVILPPIVDYIGKDVQRDDEKYILSILICLAVSVLLHWNQLLYGSVDQFATSFTVIFVESNVIFKLYFKNSLLRQKIQNIYTPSASDTTVQPPEKGVV